MKYFFIPFILLFAFTACQEKNTDTEIQAEHDAKIRADERAKVLAEFNAQKEKEAEAYKAKTKIQQDSESTLTKLGINIQDDSIIIDKNQTKAFFNALKDKVQTQMQELSDEVSTSVENTTQAGMNMTKEHINIEKTKDLLKTWNKKIEDFVDEFDTTKDSNISKGK